MSSKAEIDVAKVAHLARLELSPAEVEQFTAQIKKVLEYVDQLVEVDVTGVEPMVHPIDVETPMREDVVRPFARDENGAPKILKSAPEVIYNGYKVPQIKGE